MKNSNIGIIWNKKKTTVWGVKLENFWNKKNPMRRGGGVILRYIETTWNAKFMKQKKPKLEIFERKKNP
mgnify:CR=1 FL=1